MPGDAIKRLHMMVYNCERAGTGEPWTSAARAALAEIDEIESEAFLRGREAGRYLAELHARYPDAQTTEVIEVFPARPRPCDACGRPMMTEACSDEQCRPMTPEERVSWGLPRAAADGDAGEG